MGFCERNSESESPARFEFCSGQLELVVGAVCSDSSLSCSRGLSGLSASLFSLSNLPSAATPAFALACVRGVTAAIDASSFLLLLHSSCSSFYLVPALQQLQQHDGDINLGGCAAAAVVLSSACTATTAAARDGSDIGDSAACIFSNSSFLSLSATAIVQ